MKTDERIVAGLQSVKDKLEIQEERMEYMVNSMPTGKDRSNAELALSNLRDAIRELVHFT